LVFWFKNVGTAHCNIDVERRTFFGIKISPKKFGEKNRRNSIFSAQLYTEKPIIKGISTLLLTSPTGTEAPKYNLKVRKIRTFQTAHSEIPINKATFRVRQKYSREKDSKNPFPICGIYSAKTLLKSLKNLYKDHNHGFFKSILNCSYGMEKSLCCHQKGRAAQTFLFMRKSSTEN